MARQQNDDFSSQIIANTLAILADGIPRTARQIAGDLRNFGLTVDKSLINRVLYRQDLPKLRYDNVTYSYYLSDFPENTENKPVIRSIAETKILPSISTSPEDPIIVDDSSTIEVDWRKINESIGLKISEDLLVGMLVRLPSAAELNQNTSDFRDFRLGYLIGQDAISGNIHVVLWEHQLNNSPVEIVVTLPLHLVHRCRVLSRTPCYHRPTQQSGILLTPCTDDIPTGDFIYYYVSINGATRRIPENELRVASHRQDVNPIDQLIRYEFHNPTYRYYRDRFVQSYMELNNATTGLEELVNTRVLLLAHQAEVITRVLGDENCRYILADEVGLGKTIEACVILKGLLQRYGNFKTLVIVPSSLKHQWYNELNSKFWIRLISWRTLVNQIGQPFEDYGLIVSQEELEKDDGLWRFVQAQQWGLMILDEAHHLPRNPLLYERAHSLSRLVQRVLVLSATPIQHRSIEYLSMLRLMHPQRYDALAEVEFNKVVANQKILYDVVETVQGSLNPEYFNTQEFVELMSPLMKPLASDHFFVEQLEQINQQSSDISALEQARQLIMYISENYRIESRVIRNRRASLRQQLLPQRNIDTHYAYDPSDAEQDTFIELSLYIQAILDTKSNAAISFSESLVHSASSSPEALLDLIDLRQLSVKNKQEKHFDTHLLYFSSAHLESERLKKLTSCFVNHPDEQQLLENLKRRAEVWQEQAHIYFEKLPSDYLQRESNNRLVQILRAVHHILKQKPEAKVVVFTSWQATLSTLYDLFGRHIGRAKIAQFHTSVDPSNLQDEADRFQSDPQCRIMLCDELGGEGRNFQIATAVIHVDLPWSPTQIEQRIGRIDRLGREGIVLSVVPYANDQLEEDVFRLMQESFHVFTQSMSGLEIVVEDVREEMRSAFANDPFEGLRKLLPRMQAFAQEMRREIEMERIFEENAINQQLRQEITDISQTYQNGDELREGICAWGQQIGMANHYDSETQNVVFDDIQSSC